jgi:hypothetical protein
MKALTRMGFRGRRGKGSHIIFVFYDGAKKTGVRTMVADRSAPLGDGRMADYRGDLGLESSEEFDRFMGTGGGDPMTQEEYRRLLVERGRIR